MQLTANGKPYLYTHKCTESEKRGERMSNEEVRHFLVDVLYESFCVCNADIRKGDVFPSSKRQQPDLIYRMAGDTRDIWFYVTSIEDDTSMIDMGYVAKEVKERDIIPVCTEGFLWCLETNGEQNICGGTYIAEFGTYSLLMDENYPLPEQHSQKQLVEKVALCWKKLDAKIIEPYLDSAFHYTSDAVFYEMSSRREYMAYLCSKFDRLRDRSNPIGIKIVKMGKSNDYAILLHQAAYNQTLQLTVQVNEGRIICMRMSEMREVMRPLDLSIHQTPEEEQKAKEKLIEELVKSSPFGVMRKTTFKDIKIIKNAIIEYFEKNYPYTEIVWNAVDSETCNISFSVNDITYNALVEIWGTSSMNSRYVTEQEYNSLISFCESNDSVPCLIAVEPYTGKFDEQHTTVTCIAHAKTSKVIDFNKHKKNCNHGIIEHFHKKEKRKPSKL